jgi:hypothetical protein
MASVQPTPRRPIIGPRLSHEQFVAYLQRMERGFSTRWTMLLIGGAIVTLFGPVAIGSIVWLAQFGRHAPGEIRSWSDIVLTVACIVIPIQFLLEWLTRGKLIETVAEGLAEASSPLTYAIRGRATVGIVFIEMCLWGPRMFNAAWGKLLAAGRQKHADRAVAAKILGTLFDREGLTTAELMSQTTKDADAFGSALGYLMFHDLIGISKSGDRAWILSDAKRSLEKSATR